MKRLKTCRSCGSGELVPFLSLGRLPLASTLAADQLAAPEERQSLEAGFCKRCGLVQLLSDVVEDSPTPTAPVQGGLLEQLLHHHRLGPHHLVLALEGSGIELLRPLMQAGVRVMYLEPQPERGKAASSKGIPTRPERFDRPYAQKLRDEGLQADVVLAHQLLCHKSDLNGLLECLGLVLKDGGLVVMELPYVRPMLEARQFEHFTHSQLHYFSVSALHELVRRHGLWLQQVEPLSEGYLRCFLGKTRQVEPSVGWYLQEEQKLGLTDVAYYLEFASRIAAVREALMALLTELRARGRRVAAYGANAQGTALLNYVGLGREVIDFVVDSDTGQQGRFVAGVHIPIYGVQKLLEEQPDYLLLLGHPPDEVARQHPEYVKRGGKFIVALPHPDILTSPLAQQVQVGL
ncbi:MAG: class I SAM-dependent methyltransferase [Meiothermus sp.]|uniref:class I SAM-dependent methyltransferase n=1 Tax=Meiothermus sp. TaxID=1955249 RepID=UPI0025CC62F4|nr:class I SAM-dependent methyltransferase [Meiothermus sp.]MCS7068656.1 class I SAM-dependent methyltransferase [Meiothermus sp.]